MTFVDSLPIVRKHNNHKLASSLKYYTGEDLEDAHDAKADVYATFKILVAQLERERCQPR